MPGDRSDQIGLSYSYVRSFREVRNASAVERYRACLRLEGQGVIDQVDGRACFLEEVVCDEKFGFQIRDDVEHDWQGDRVLVHPECKFHFDSS